MNRAIIDTDILSYYFKGDIEVVKNFKEYLLQYDVIEISLIKMIIVTNNESHFGRIPGLKIENWKKNS